MLHTLFEGGSNFFMELLFTWRVRVNKMQKSQVASTYSGGCQCTKGYKVGVHFLQVLLQPFEGFLSHRAGTLKGQELEI